MSEQPSNANAPLYTAARIAAVLGKKRQSIQRLLERSPISGQVLVNGNLASAWSYAALPESLKEKLAIEAKRRCVRDAEQLISNSGRRWEPPIAMADIAQHCLDKAVKLQRALALTFGRINDLSLSEGEFEQMGVDDYKRVFGHTISTRHWRDLFKRTIERDGGEEAWNRVELYLDQNPARSASSRPLVSCADESFRELSEVITAFRNPADPSSKEQDYLWGRAVRLFNAIVESGKAPKKRALLDFLWRHAPRLAKSPNALRVSFDRRLTRWIESDGLDPLLDGREEKKGVARAAEYNQEDIDAIVWEAAANCGGRVRQAVRNLVECESLSPEMLRMFLRKPSRKSYIPNRLDEAVRYDVPLVHRHLQGKRYIDKALGSLDLEYSGIYAMDALMADDFTMPVYWRVPDGQGWFRLVRGQLILVIDFRTLCILGFSLQPDEQYNSAVTRTVFTKIFRERGLPKFLYLERGKVWQTSKLMTGGPNAPKSLAAAQMPFSDAEVELGLKQFGIEFIHARRARSKPVERVGGMLQDLMEGEPGYCGRDERRDRPESLTKQMKEVERHQVHPSKYFYCFDQWEARIKELCEKYNSNRQEGKRLPDLTPAEAFEKFQNKNDPPQHFGPSCEFLFAHHRIPVEVDGNGIVFRVRGETFKYRDEQTGQRIGKRLLAHFNPELPELLTVTDKHLKDAFTVERVKKVNALYTDETYESEVEKVHAHAEHGKARYQVLKLKFKQTFRQLVADRTTVELGRTMERQQETILTRREQQATKRSQIDRLAKELGISSSALADSDDVEGYAKMMIEAERAAQAEVESGGKQ